jgi:apolipoprotein N-acyltransferase
MVGAAAIFGLYLITPLIILLNAVLPADWNKLIVALTVLMLGEFMILLILIKTTPRHKAKKGNMLVQP